MTALTVTGIIFFGYNKTISQVTDYDSNTYKTVNIGSQIWMAENLNVEHYRNGDIIPQVQDSAQWVNLTTGAWCYYDNDVENGKTYGKLYNWYAVNDPRGLAPKGWHVPSDAEWTNLVNFLGGENVNGGKLKATTLWQENPNILGTTNDSKFTAFPGGMRFDNGLCYEVEKEGYFWSSTEYLIYANARIYVWYRNLTRRNSDIYRNNAPRENGLSVRCIKN